MSLGIIILLTIAAPLLGAILAWVFKGGKQKQLKIFLSFSGAYLFTISVSTLMPEIYQEGTKLTGILVIAGFMFQILLEQFTRGVEHGHIHYHPEKEKGSIYQVVIGMSLHAFLEGMPIGDQSFIDKGISSQLLPGTCIHEIPAAFALGSLLTVAGFKGYSLWSIMLPYCFMIPTGALVSNMMGSSEGLQEIIHIYLLPFVVGAFLHISTTILYENSENHHYNRIRFLAILLGIGLAFLGLLGS